MDFCDTHAIARLMQTRDPRALAHVSHCYGARLIAVARRACRVPEDAEDAVQDALVEAARSMDSYRGEGSPFSWITTLVVRRCHRLGRGLRNDPALHVHGHEAVCGCGDPEVLVAHRELAEQLARAIQALEPLDRSVVVLAHEGLTGPEIGASLGLTPNAVRSRLKRSRRGLRASLLDVGGEEIPQP